MRPEQGQRLRKCKSDKKPDHNPKRWLLPPVEDEA